MTAENFGAWFDFCQAPNRDGLAADTAPGDPETRFGFTYPTWVTARRYMGTTGNTLQVFRRATQGDMRELAQGFIWERNAGDQLPAGSDVSVIDWRWTSGGAIFDIQQELGFTSDHVDGVIGPVTLAAIEHFGPSFVFAVHGWRCNYYDDLGLKKLYPGLYLRSDACLKLALNLMGN